LLGVLLPILWSSVAAAVPTLTSGSLSMGAGTFPGNFGGGNFTTSDDASISFFYGSPFGFSGSTGAAIDWSQMDALITNVVYAGKSFPFCGDVPGSGFQGACAFMDSISLSMTTPQTPPPPLPGGPLSITVPGTFSVSQLSVQLFDAPPFHQVGVLPTSDTPSPFGYGATGPASLTFDWCPECFRCPDPSCGPGAWQFVSGFGEIEPTPEPATLLLFGTSAAGLGLAWRKRRRA
jgi:hypothetical protein